MSVNFHRAYELIIGKPYKEKDLIIPSSVSSPKIISDGVSPPGQGGGADLHAIPATSWTITGLQLRAKVSQTKTNTTPISIEVFNFPEDILSEIEKDDVIVLRAGYKNKDASRISVASTEYTLPDLFVGQISQIAGSHTGSDRVIKFTAAENATISKNAHISKSYPPDTTRYAVLQDFVSLLQSVGVPLGGIDLSSSNKTEWGLSQKPLLGGYVAKGLLMEALENLCESMQLRSYSSVGRLYIEPKSSEEKIRVFKADASQILGKPTPLHDNTTTTSNEGDKKDSGGQQFRFWLDGRITVDQILVVSGTDGFDGTYKIVGVVHDLDYRNKSKWTTTVSVEKIS